MIMGYEYTEKNKLYECMVVVVLANFKFSAKQATQNASFSTSLAKNNNMTTTKHKLIHLQDFFFGMIQQYQARNGGRN
jgi:hypothetical protein